MTRTSITGEQSPHTPRLRRIATALLLIVCAFGFVATPTPVLAEDVQLSPVRRTTIASAVPQASLRFYRDILGFTVEYDVVATEPGQLAAFAPGAKKGRAIA